MQTLNLSADQLTVLRNALSARSVQLDEQIANVEAFIERVEPQGAAPDRGLHANKRRHRASLVVELDAVHRLDGLLLAAVVDETRKRV